ncbi:MAG: zinc-binding dehydrogenase [Rhodothermales bacterium]
MQQSWITRAGGPEVLELREAPTPEPGPGQVRIRVEASGVNFADVMARRGLYPDAPPLPTVVGYEVAGTIDAVGPGVERSLGEPVLAFTRFGGYSTHVIVVDGQAIARPAGMPVNDAAALLVNYITAFQAMVLMGSIRRPEEIGRPVRVLVLGASGGVGTAAADLGRYYGAEMYGAASASKHAYVRERGYAHALDYRETGWEKRAKELTDGHGFDLILDPVGGESWSTGFDLLAPAGRMVMFGFSTAFDSGKTMGKLAFLKAMTSVPWLKFLPFPLIDTNKGVLGLNAGHLWGYPEEVRRWIDRLLELYTEGHLKPEVDRTFPLAEAGAAHAYLEERRNRGKVLLIP